VYFSLRIYNVISGYLLMLGHVKRVYTCAYTSDIEFHFEGLANVFGYNLVSSNRITGDCY